LPEGDIGFSRPTTDPDGALDRREICTKRRLESSSALAQGSRQARDRVAYCALRFRQSNLGATTLRSSRAGDGTHLRDRSAEEDASLRGVSGPRFWTERRHYAVSAAGRPQKGTARTNGANFDPDRNWANAAASGGAWRMALRQRASCIRRRAGRIARTRTGWRSRSPSCRPGRFC
jgi:hypothetical protein